MADIVYTYGNQAYLNITNACPCRCTFCIRNNGDSVGEATTLWFDHNPTIEEIKGEIDKFDFSKYNNSIIICGYGEPTCALNNLIESCKYLKSKGINIRLNTNGLSDLINKRETAKEICEVIDSVSISLNAPTAEKYDAVTRASFGEKAFDAMLKFAKECKDFGIPTKLTVVDVISKEDIKDCQKLCDEIGIPLRVREYTAEQCKVLLCNEVNPCGFMKYPSHMKQRCYEVRLTEYEKDLLYFIFANGKYFIIENYFILHGNTSFSLQGTMPTRPVIMSF